MATPFIAELRIFGFSFPPRGWALCNGQLLSIAQNQALFALLGTNYGGDGIRTFGFRIYRGTFRSTSDKGSTGVLILRGKWVVRLR